MSKSKLINISKHKSGFTLVEILMTLGIVSILLITLTQVFGGIISLRLKNDITTTLAQDSRYLFSILEYDLVSTANLVAPATSTTGSTLTLISRGKTITYSYNSSILTRSDGTTTTEVITETPLSNFVVSRGLDIGGKATVTITYTLSTPALSDSPAQSRTFTTTYGLRTL